MNHPPDQSFNEWNAPGGQGVSPEEAASVDGGEEVGLQQDLAAAGAIAAEPRASSRIRSTLFSGRVPRWWAGPLLIATYWILGGIYMPFSIWVIEEMFNGRPSMMLMFFLLPSVFFPPAAMCSLAAVIPMFVNLGVFARFGLSLLMVVPGFLAMAGAFEMLEEHFPDELYHVTSAFAVVACLFSVVIQLWSGRTLVHLGSSGEIKNPLGILAMMQLTLLFSIMLAFAMQLEGQGIWLGVIVMSGLGGLATLITFFGCFCFLGERVRWKFALGVPGVLAYFGSMLGLIAFLSEGFSINVSQTDLVRLSLFSLYGGALICTLMVTGFLTFRWAGWRLMRVGERVEAWS